MGVVLVPLAALQFGVKESVGIMSVYFLFQNINKVAVFHKHINWKIAWKVIVFSLPGVFIGIYTLTVVPVDLFKKILATFILFYLANDLFKLIPKRGQPEKMVPVISFGYGFISGLMGSGNIIKGTLFLSLGLAKEAYLGTYAITSFFMNVPKVFTYYAAGILLPSQLKYAIPFVFISILGTYIGKKLLHVVPIHIFKYIITASIALSALLLLIE